LITDIYILILASRPGSSLTRQSGIANPTESKATALYHNEMDLMYGSCKILSSKFFFEIATEDNYFFAE
jgi:hypothetical protein